MEKKQINWGILGTGAVAHNFARAFPFAENANLYAVGSRAIESAAAFAAEFTMPKAYGSYSELVSDPDIDVVYVSSPHSYHKPHSLLAIEHNKAVVCEKPFTLNAAEARAVFAAAKTKQVFCMEGMWTRFFPVIQKMHEWIKEGKIGDVMTVTADFGFNAVFDPESRIFSPALGGGALLDVGVYPLSLAYYLFGMPTEITSSVSFSKTGVDSDVGLILTFEQGKKAILHTSITVDTPQEAFILGTDGYIHLPRSWWNPSVMHLYRGGTVAEHYEAVRRGNGFEYEISAVSKALCKGRIETEDVRSVDTLAVMTILDQVRETWRVREG